MEISLMLESAQLWADSRLKTLVVGILGDLAKNTDHYEWSELFELLGIDGDTPVDSLENLPEELRLYLVSFETEDPEVLSARRAAIALLVEQALTSVSSSSLEGEASKGEIEALCHRAEELYQMNIDPRWDSGPEGSMFIPRLGTASVGVLGLSLDSIIVYLAHELGHGLNHREGGEAHGSDELGAWLRAEKICSELVGYVPSNFEQILVCSLTTYGIVKDASGNWVVAKRVESNSWSFDHGLIQLVEI